MLEVAVDAMVIPSYIVFVVDMYACITILEFWMRNQALGLLLSICMLIRLECGLERVGLQKCGR